MNCAECQEQLVACAEGLLDPGQSLACRAHLETCAACRAEFEAVVHLHQELTVRGQTAAGVSLVQPVMRRVLQARTEPESNTIMSLLQKYRWGFGLGAAATAATAVIAILTLTSPQAFGIEQVIEAYGKIRFLHVKDYQDLTVEPSEFWIQTNDRGEVEKARYYLPHTEDGAKLITWTPERTELWFQSKRGFTTFQTRRIAPWMQSLLSQCQPQIVLSKLLERRKSGEVEVEIRPGAADQPGLIVATYKKDPRKEVYFTEPKTALISRIEFYRREGASEELVARTEFSDYNVPIEAKMFSIRGDLPKDVRISDRLNQVSGVAQGSMTDEQAAIETVRQFFQALLDKDYKQAGLICGGTLEEYAREEFGGVNVTRILSIGPAEAQKNWAPHGFRVPCQLEVIYPDGQRAVWKPGPYVRPGDDEMHPEQWNITGGVEVSTSRMIPDNAKYAGMTPKQAAEVFFKACAESNWDEVLKFWPRPETDARFERLKDYLGGLEVIRIGEPVKSDDYAGTYVPYEIKLRPQEFNLRMSNSNRASRFVITGAFDRRLRPLVETPWTNEPAILPDNDTYARLTPAEAAAAYFRAAASRDWEEMRKFAPDYDVESDRRQVAKLEKAGLDPQQVLPVREVLEAFWSAEQSAWFVKCRMLQVKKWQLAIRNDNPAGRWMFDGGL